MIPGIVAGGMRNGEPTPTIVTLDPANTAADLSLSSGNLNLTRLSTNNLSWRVSRATLGRSAGKYVFACTNVVNTTNGFLTGLIPAGHSLTEFAGFTSASYGLHSPNGRAYNNNASVGTDLGATGSAGTHHLAVDFDAGKIWVGQNNVWSGDPAAGTGQRFNFTPNTPLYPAVCEYQNTQQALAKFSAAAYPYAVPAGFSTWGA